MPYVELEKDGAIATVTVNRPEALNAVNEQVVQELTAAFDELEADDAVKVIILTGAGDKAFIAGGDIAAMGRMNLDEGRKFVYAGQAMVNKIEKCNKVVIAQINGYALGGGTEIAMGCDIRIASERARLGVPEVTVGLFPGWGGTQRLARLVGKGRAKELVFTGEHITAEEAYRIGLVNKVVPHDELKAYCRQLAEKILANSFVAVRQAKKALNEGPEMALPEGLTYEAESWLVNFASEDRREGLNAFVEKRKPNFQDK